MNSLREAEAYPGEPNESTMQMTGGIFVSPGRMQMGAYVNRMRTANGYLWESKEEGKGV